MVCLNGDVIRRETISAMPAGNAKFLMDSVFELAQRINRFRLSDAEIGLFCSVVIITAGAHAHSLSIQYLQCCVSDPDPLTWLNPDGDPKQRL